MVLNMSKQFKLIMILVNVLLGLLYVYSSYLLWEELNFWCDYNIQTTWTPFIVYLHRIPGLPTVEMPLPLVLNLPFIMFCVIIATNSVMLATYYYIVPRLQRWATKSM